MAKTFTNEKQRADEPVETVRLAGGNRGLRMPNGDVLDPTFATASNLCRMPESHFQIVLRWIDAERERLRLHAEQAERVGREVAEAMRPELEEQARGRADWVSRNWSPGT